MPKLSPAAQLANINSQIEALKKKQAGGSSMTKAQERALARVVTIVKSSGLTLADLSAALKTTKKKSAKKATTGNKRAPAKPKYRNPADSAQTWTGRGRMPKWVEAMHTAGTLDSAKI